MQAQCSRIRHLSLLSFFLGGGGGFPFQANADTILLQKTTLWHLLVSLAAFDQN